MLASVLISLSFHLLFFILPRVVIMAWSLDETSSESRFYDFKILLSCDYFILTRVATAFGLRVCVTVIYYFFFPNGVHGVFKEMGRSVTEIPGFGWVMAFGVTGLVQHSRLSL